MRPDDLKTLERAVEILENPGLIARLTGALGKPLESAFDLLPAKWAGVVQEAVHDALMKALKIALSTMKADCRGRPANLIHRTLSAISGAAGGAFGMASLPVELPVSTAIMLRSIADIARNQGEAIGSVESQLACIEVFALGGRDISDDESKTAYYAVRSMLAKEITEAAEFIAEKGIIEEGAPAVLRFVAQVASRYEIAVSEKLAAQAVPVVGAIGGASVNLWFTTHFQNMAKGHFAVRRLERIYGKDAVRSRYVKTKAAALP